MEQPDVKAALVEYILRHARHFSWTEHANGRISLMLKPDQVCINVFDARYRQPGTTEIHSHSMDFRSEIIAGRMRQYRYRRTDDPAAAVATRCGVQDLTLDGKLAGDARLCYLIEGPLEEYRAGEAYEITAPEIHRSDPEDGTVTLIARQYKTSPAGVSAFWLRSSELAKGVQGQKFVPPAAGAAAVDDIVSRALSRWPW